MLVDREVSDQPFQPTVFCFQLSEPTQFTHVQVRVLHPPGIEGDVAHPDLPAEVADGVPVLACRIAYTVCTVENFDRGIGPLLSYKTAEADISLWLPPAIVFCGDVRES